ncbi:MAG TPA: tetratricopeptide repeat protein [Patescibacteria group bacterium]
MRQSITAYVDNAITFLLLAVAGITPLLFLGQTTEFYDIPKLTFLLVTTTLLLGLWIFSWILKGKISINRTPLDIPLLVLLLTVLVSTYFSVSKPIAIYGNFPKVHASSVAWVVYILLYFVTASNLRSVAKIKNFLYVLYASGALVAVVTILAFFNVFLPISFAHAVNFTPTGSSFSTIAFLLLLLPLPLLSLVTPNKYMPLPLAASLAILFGVTVALIGSLPTYIVLALVVVLAVVVAKPHHIQRTLPLFALPIVVVALTFAIAYLPFPGNAVQKLESNFPKEIQLPFSTSWKVSASTFRDAPFIGTGPSSYLFDFTAYKPLEFNASNLWSFSFDTAYNEFLQVLGTLGAVGLGTLLVLSLIILNSARKNMTPRASEDEDSVSSKVILPGLAISGAIAIVLLAVHATTLISTVSMLFIFAAFMMSQRSIREKVMDLSMGLKASTAEGAHFDLFPVIVFILFLVLAVPAMYQTYTAVAADVYHRQALVAASTNGTLTYQDLQKAEALNPQIDLYRVDMAQTNFALANALAIKKGPSQDNPKGSLTDQDKQTIQTLLQQSINEGKVAVALSPLSARNWEVLAAIYRNISGVAQNALTFSLSAYSNAIQRDPLNPALRINAGGIYYTAKNYDQAVRFFSDAANLKPDYANAYYNLVIALREKGDLQNAKLVADQLVSLLQKDPKSADYKVATALQAEINQKLQQSQSENGGQQAPASQTNSALSNPNIPVSTNLGNPPAVTPVPSVKPNPNTNLPKISPAPTAAQ